MARQIWSATEEKKANILVLLDHEVHRLEVTGNALTFKRNLRNVLEKLEQGISPGLVGASKATRLDARTVAKAAVEPGNRTFKLFGPGEKPEVIKYRSSTTDADSILGAVLAESGRTFEPSREPIGLVETLMPPVFVGLIGALFAFLMIDSAAGRKVEIKGRRQGLQRMLAGVGEMLGTTGLLVAAGLFALLIGSWIVRQVTHRPERTVLLPATA